MKKRFSMLVLLVAGFVFMVPELPAEPGTRSPSVNRRERKQKARIKQGVKSGELTQEEAKKLREEQIAIRKKEREMKSDGTLTKDERKELHQDLKESSQNIYEEKHDAEKR